MNKKTIFIIMLAIIFLTGCSKKEKIVIYSSMEEERNQDLTKSLKAEFPDLNVTVQLLSTGNNAAKVKSEGTNIEANIILGLELAHTENLKENFMDLSNYDTSKYIEGINPNHNKYVVWEKYTASVIIDKTYFEEHNLTVPKTYDDLLKSEYKSLIAMPDPKTSGTGYMYYLNVVNIKGEKGALNYFKELSKNIKQFTTSGSGPISLLKQGEIAIAMGMTYQGVAEINKGANYEIIEFDTGTPYNFTASGIINGKETDNVKKVFQWLISDWIYYDKENYIPGKILKNQKNKIKNYPEYLKDADMKNVENIQTKEKLTNEWAY